ncbi:MAG: single-stranded DNA-binding protein [Chloroflexi bacterium]|nr:single-stranded DNA-binding protein [Chloroflexota bacterium]
MFQKTIIVGNLGKDPEMRYTPSGVAVTSFSVAVNRRWSDQQGQPQEKTTWFRVTAWRKLAELCNQYLSKGRMVLVEGEIDASAWQGQDGQPRASLELTARTVRFLGGSAGGGELGSSALHEGPPVEEGDIPF